MSSLNKIAFLPMLAFLAAVFIYTASASNAVAQSSGRLTQEMEVVGANELMAGKYPIRLWGVETMDGFNPYALKAIEKLERYAAEGKVTCRLIAKDQNTYLGKCLAFSGADLALILIDDGLASVDRRLVKDDKSAKDYLVAEQHAKSLKKGIWAEVGHINAVAETGAMDDQLIEQDEIILMAVIIIGFLIIGVVVRSGFKSIEARHQKEQEEAAEREDALHDRERGVLAAAMIGELEENKAKIEAFMRIYETQLADVSDQTKPPKYQISGGDSVAQHPVLNHTVFEANSARLSLLGMKMAGDVSRLYSMFHKDAEYITLEAEMPQPQAIDILGRIVADARGLLPQIDQLVSQLNEMR